MNGIYCYSTEKFHERRFELGISMTQLAKITNSSYSTVSKIENGGRVYYKTAKKFAVALDMPMKKLFSEIPLTRNEGSNLLNKSQVENIPLIKHKKHTNEIQRIASARYIASQNNLLLSTGGNSKGFMLLERDTNIILYGLSDFNEAYCLTLEEVEIILSQYY